MFSKEHILAEIKRTAQENGGTAPGIARFEAETGIRTSDYIGRFWARWGDALVEAGYQPNVLQGPRGEDELLEALAAFTRELGHFPVANEIKLKARNEAGFPWHNTFARFGGKLELVARLRAFASARGYADVVELCEAALARVGRQRIAAVSDGTAVAAQAIAGAVYLLKSGRFYKIGRSNAVGRRERELSIQLPQESRVVHSIKTDDPPGIEAYWHNRFAERRRNGEWFELIAEDVAAFKRRKFM